MNGIRGKKIERLKAVGESLRCGECGGCGEDFPTLLRRRVVFRVPWTDASKIESGSTETSIDPAVEINDGRTRVSPGRNY